MAQPRTRSSRSLERDPVADRLWIEQFALLQELLNPNGLSRTANRIQALLLISDAQALTQAQLVERLDLSQAAVSPAVRELVRAGVVAKTRTPGVRGDQYSLLDLSLATILQGAGVQLDTIIGHLEAATALAGPDLSAGRSHLANYVEVYRGFREIVKDASARLEA